MIPTPTTSYGVLLQRPHTGQGLSRVHDYRSGSLNRLHEFCSEAGNSAQVHEKIQSNTFVGKDAREFAVDVEYAGSSGTSGSVVDQNFNVSDFRKNAGGNPDTTENAVGLGLNVARSKGVRVQATGSQIAWTDVFAQ
jgi:hypothetical protein